MATRISLALSAGGASAAASELRSLARRCSEAVDKACGAVAEAGLASATAVAPASVAASISVRKEAPGRYLLVADGPVAAFLEFGTGVVGSGTYQGELPSFWGYDLRRTPEAHDRNDPTKWYFMHPDTGRRMSTRGIAAYGFMAAAAEEMRAKAATAVKEALRA